MYAEKPIVLADDVLGTAIGQRQELSAPLEGETAARESPIASWSPIPSRGLREVYLARSSPLRSYTGDCLCSRPVKYT